MSSRKNPAFRPSVGTTAADATINLLAMDAISRYFVVIPVDAHTEPSVCPAGQTQPTQPTMSLPSSCKPDPAPAETRVRVRFSEEMMLVGFGLAAIYWLLDSIVYIFLSYDIGFFSNILGLELGDVWTRLIVTCLFAIFGSHAQYTINKRRVVEQRLRESEEKYRTIIESVEDGYFEVDLQANFTFFNDALCRILGFPHEEMLGMNQRETMDDENARRVFETFDAVLRTGQSAKSLDWVLITKYGARRFVEASVSLIRDAEEQPSGFRGILRDITDRHRAEALQRAKVAADLANRSKTEFLANMSHEIRTPLNSIIGLVELMQESELNSEQRADLEVVVSAAYSLLAVINDILDFSKIEAGKLELELIAFNLRDFVGEALRIMSGKAHEKSIELAYRVAPDVPAELYGDPARLRQVLLNLVGNALKFTAQGEVVVTVNCEDQSADNVDLHFTVRDTGIGIPKEKQTAIFDAFRQADGSTSRRYGGTGLGLAISAQLVGLMGGRIWVESEPDQGSTFHFTIRLGRYLDMQVMPPEMPDLAGRHVLALAANPTTGGILREMLESWQMRPSIAVDFSGAQERIRKAAADGRPVEVVMVDVVAIDSDGVALIRWLRSQPQLDTPAIMLLSHSRLRREPDLSRLAPCATTLKPVRPSDLLTAILVCLGHRTSEVAESKQRIEAPPAFGGRSLHLLVAEDTPFNQKYIRRLLERWGLTADIVENGRLAIEALAQRAYDIVLMDVQMPEMDGFEATRAIRRQEAQDGGHIPIIAMTAHAMKGDRERCLEVGMDAYVAKPIAAELLQQAIETYLVDRNAAPAPEAPTAPVALDIDRKALLIAFDHDWNFLAEVFEMFRSDYPNMLDGLRRAVAAGDADGVKRAAHALKGMVGNFQAKAAAAAAFDLEKMGRNGLLDGAEAACETLAREIAHLEETLAQLVRKGSNTAPD